jgi:hypothetical protein
MTGLQTEQIRSETEEVPGQLIPQIEPGPVEQPAQTIPTDAEEYINLWMKKAHRQNSSQ